MKKCSRSLTHTLTAALVVGAGFSSLALQAQTWVGGFGGNVFNNASNWTSPASVPTTGADLIFTGPNNNTGPAIDAAYSVNSITFTNLAPHYFLGTANSSPFTLTITGTGATNGVTVNASTVSTPVIDFNQSLSVAFGANQTWQIDGNLAVGGNVSGAFSLTKNGSGYLSLNGSNSYSGGTTINAGTLYLGQTNSSSGTITIAGAGATLASTFSSDLTLANAITAHSGATFGTPLNGGRGNFELNGTVTVDSTSSTINLGNTEVFFANPLTAAASTNLTVSGTGLGMAILGSTSANTNIANITADNAAVIFTQAAGVPASVQALNGGYVSVATLATGTPPGDTAVLDAITNKAAFNGVLGFDTDDNLSLPHTYTSAINLTGFTSGNVRLGSATSAILSGTITPAGSTYDFGGFAGQDGVLAVTSDLTNHGGGVTVVSPSASGGAAQNGLGLVLRGNNSFAGDISVSYSAVILDSANALPSGRNFSLGASSYIGYTNQTSFTSFANFATHLTSYTSTSVLGVDSNTTLTAFLNGSGSPANQVVNDATIDLSGYSSIFLGTATGATFNTTTLKAPSDGVLRLVNLGEAGTLAINADLKVANNVNSLVVGLPGSEGTVILTNTGTNDFAGGTTIQGGGLQISSSNTLGTGNIAFSAVTNGRTPSLGASAGSVTLANNISAAGDFRIGTGGYDESNNFTAGTTALTLNGVISNNGTAGRMYVMGPTTINGLNTYTGGTYILADTTVTTNSGLGTNFVDLGYKDSLAQTKSTLTFTSAHPSIGNLSDAGNFIGGAGTGNISLDSGVTDLSITQTSFLTYSGQISSVGAANLIKRGGNQLLLTGNNTYSGTTTINGGALNLTGASGRLSGTSALTISGGSVNSGDASNSGANGLANRINTSAPLTLGGTNGGGTFNLVRGALTTESQSFASLTVGTGSNSIGGNGSGNTAPTLTFSGATPYVRSLGGILNFGTNTNAIPTFTSAPSGAGNVSGAGSDAILVGATLTASNFVSAASGAITSASASYVATAGSTWTTGKNMNVTAATTVATAADVNSVRFNTNVTLTLPAAGTSNIASGMVLVPSGVGASTITGGAIAGSAGGDLILNNSGSAGLTVSSAIVDNGSATGLTKAGTSSVTISGANTYTGTTTIAQGSLLLGSATALNNTPVAIFGGTLNLNGFNASIGTLTAPGGTITLGGNTLTINQASNTTFSGSLNGTGGALVKNGAGTLTLGASNPYTGATTINAGILLVNGTTSSSTFSVVSGATLGGNGTVGPVNVAAGATIGPGNTSANGLLSTGNLSLLGTTMMELGGTTRGSGGYDAINVTGNISFGGALTVTYLGVYNPTSGSSYDLFNWTGTPSGTFSTLNLPSLDPGLTWDTSNLYTTGVISAVPEPSTYAAIAATMMLGFAIWRRRQLRAS